MQTPRRYAPMGGSFAPVRVAAFKWNGWQASAVYASKPRDVILDLLECMNIHEEDLPARINERKLEKLLFKQLVINQVRCILVDEFQHLLRLNNASVNGNVANFIKVLASETGISIGLFGMEEGVRLLRLDRQVKTRWITPYTLQPLGLNTNGEPEYFSWFLQQLLEMYPRQTREFASRDNALRFLLASEGNLRELKKFLTPLIRDTEHCPDKVLTMKDVDAVYRIITENGSDTAKIRGRSGHVVYPFSSPIERVEGYLRDASRL